MEIKQSVEQNAPERSDTEAGIFYGWLVVGATFSLLLICFGVAYAFAAFFQALQREFNATRADISLIFAISAAIYFSLGAISGPVADRLGPRWVVAAGMLLVAIGLLTASRAEALWQIYLTYSLSVGLGVGLAYVPAISTVQRWFVRRRGLASGIATAGIGVGTLVAPPFTSVLIDFSGWRNTYLILAIITALFGTSAALILVHSPQRRGLLPDGATRPTAAANPGTTATPNGATLKQALTSRPFWLMYSASVAVSFGLFIPFVHLAAYSRDQGLADGVGVLLIGLIGIGSTAGRFVMGGWADKLGRRQTLVIMFSGLTLILLWWLLATQVWSLVLFALVFGLCYGGFVALIPALTADYYGGRSVSSIIGILYTSVALGSLLGPTLAGAAYDVSHSYSVPIIASAITSAVAIFCLLLAPNPAVFSNRWRKPDNT